MAKTAFIDKVLDEVKITKINEYEVDDDVVDVHFKQDIFQKRQKSQKIQKIEQKKKKLGYLIEKTSLKT